MFRFLGWIILACAMPLAGGCAHYEYDLIQPAAYTRHIGTQAPTDFTIGQTQYSFIAYDNYLVMHLENLSDSPLRILGDQSFVVDPEHQSHPIPSQTVGPHSFIKLVLPPPPSVYYDDYYAPAYYGGWGWGWHHGFGDPYFVGYSYSPSYANYYSSGQEYWDWLGDTQATLTLTLKQADSKPTAQTFLFRQTTVR